MAPTTTSERDATSGRSGRLAKFFDMVLRGRRALHNAVDGNLFLESVCEQKDHSNCIEKLVASPEGMNSLKKAFRFDCESATFLNGIAAAFLRYLADDPLVRELLSGTLLKRVLLVVVDPPTFWTSLVNAHEAGLTNHNGEHALAWLLLELLSWSDDQPADLHSVAQQKVAETCKFSFLRSAVPKTCILGHKIKKLLDTTTKGSVGAGPEPGGRHDNDFANFRQIAVLPTANEIHSDEKPFYRRADFIEQVKSEDRGTVHLDNQFRLLREDLLGELRNDLQIALGQKKGKRTNYTAQRLSFEGIDCGSELKRQQCALLLRCNADFPQLKGLPLAKRKGFVKDNFYFMKHRSFGGLVDENGLVAFATLDRNEDLLARDPPVLNLQITDNAALSRTMLASKISRNLQFLQVATAVFAYEPILKCLQQKLDLPLETELLPDHEIIQPQKSSIASLCAMARDIGDLAGRNLQPILKTPKRKSIHLDESQAQSLRTGLTQALSLIQGPPGKLRSQISSNEPSY